MTVKHRHWLALTAGAAILIILAGCAVVYLILFAPNPRRDGEVTSFTIKEGMNLTQVAQKLAEAGVIADAMRFKLAAKLYEAERRLQPGLYHLPAGLSNLDLLKHIIKAHAKTVNVTIPEGLTVRQIAGLLADKLGVDTVRFHQLCEDSAFTVRLGIDAGRLEGYLFPSTYNFYLSSTEEDLIARLVSQFQTVMTDSLKMAAMRLGLTVHEAVTLASIIQGEVMVWDEAPLVSSVYHNRLKRGIALGADPTIQYVLPDGPRRLFLRDLKIDSPYNTYTQRGLPPGPICNPGKKAIKAAVKPAETSLIYFVAKGDGSHFFNSTHDGHLRDKLKLQQVRRELAEQRALDSLDQE